MYATVLEFDWGVFQPLLQSKIPMGHHAVISRRIGCHVDHSIDPVPVSVDWDFIQFACDKTIVLLESNNMSTYAGMPTSVGIDSSEDDLSICWVCFQSDTVDQKLERLCRCPSRLCHARCLARWCLHSAGKR